MDIYYTYVGTRRFADWDGKIISAFADMLQSSREDIVPQAGSMSIVRI